MAGFITVPDAPHYWLLNGRVPLALLGQDVTLGPIPSLQAYPHQEELVAVDLEVRGGAIAHITPAGQAPGKMPAVDLRQGLIWPCFVDMHTHLDKGHIWPRSPNPDGTFASALETV
ncbi:MAG: cytosine deaminase, partial [Cyanobacteria bacterium P01_D01_bin.2]